MEIKPPRPVVPATVWRDFKDLQEWETHHQRRPETLDKHSEAFIALTESLAQEIIAAVPLWLVTHVDLHRTLKVQSFVSVLKRIAANWSCT